MCRILETNIDETGAGNLRGVDALTRGEHLGQRRGEFPRRDAGLLGQGQGHIGGVIAMIAIAGALEMNLVGHRDRDLTAGGKLGQRTADDDG